MSFQSQKTYQQNISRVPPYLTKYHVVDKKTDDEMVKKIFLSIEEGNVYKIHETLNNNTSSFFIKDQNDETILHAIIKSTNLTKNEKLDLCNYVIQRGTQISSYNKLNVTPLHIASKLQLDEIVKLLIEKGANPSALDNQNMNCLHYAVQSIIKQCENVKVKKLFGNKSFESKILKDLLNDIIKILHDDDTVNIHLKHIKHTLNDKNIYDMITQQINIKKNEYNTTIANIIQQIDINDDEKKKKIITENSKFQTEIEAIFKNNFTDIKPLEIQPNRNTGWGIDPTRKIFKFNSVKDILDEIENSIIENKNKKIDKYNETITKSVNVINEFETNLNNMNNLLNRIYQFIVNFEQNEPAANNNASQIITNLLSDPINTYQRLDIDYRQINPVNKNNRYNLQLPKIQRGNKKEREGWKKNNETIKFLDLTNINNGYSQQEFINYISASIAKGAPAAPALGNPIALNAPLLMGNYILDNFYCDIDFIKENINHLQNSYSELRRQLNDNIFIGLYDKHIIFQINKIINICIYLKKIKEHLVEHNNKISQIKNIVQIINQNNNNAKFEYLLDYALDDIINIEKIIKELDSKVIEIFTNINLIQNDITEIILTVTQLNSLHYMKIYNNLNNGNDLLNFDLDNINLNYFGYDKLLMRNIIPSLDKFPDILPNLNEYHKIIIESYLPEINRNNNTTYYISQNEKNILINPPVIPLPYYYLDNDGIQQNLLIPPLSKSIIGFLSTFNFNLAPNISDTTINDEVDAPIATNIGKIGFDDEFLVIRKRPAPPIIYTNIGKHFSLIKTRIVQYILIKMNGMILDSKTNIISSLQKNGINNYNSILDTIISRFTDEIIISFINHNITKNVKIISYKILNNIIITKKTDAEMNSNDDLTNELINDKSILLKQVDIFDKNKNFSLNMTEIIDTMIELYLSSTTPYDKITALNYTLNLSKDNPNDEENNNSIININHTENLCVSINPKIVDLLIKNRVNINQNNIAGETPIYYAIENQNSDIIQKLIENGAFVENITNKNGMSPKQILINKIKNIYNKFNNPVETIQKLTINSYDKLKDKLMKKPEYKNNILLYTENILPLLITLLNYNFLKITNLYPRKWSFTDSTNLFSLITNKLNIQNIQNITDILTLINIPSNNLSTNRTINKKIEEYNKKEKYLQENIEEIEHQIAELEKEKNTVIDITNIDAKIATLTNSMTQLINKRNAIITKKGQADVTNTRINVNNGRLINNTIIIKNDDVCQELDKYMEDINSGKLKYGSEYDLHIYQNLLDNYLKNIKNLDSLIYIHLSVSRTVSLTIDNYVQNDIELINDWYTKIACPFIKDYFELPQDLSDKKNIEIGLEKFDVENYALDKTINIITQTMKSTIFITLFYSVLKTLTKYVEEVLSIGQFASDLEYGQYLEKYITKIVYNESNGESELMKYIIDVIPNKVVKFVLKIYEGDGDPDKKIKTLDEILIPIKTILINNTLLPINQTTSIIKNLDDYVFPYFKDYFELFITEAKHITDSYYQSILTESKMINILQIMNKKLT